MSGVHLVKVARFPWLTQKQNPSCQTHLPYEMFSLIQTHTTRVLSVGANVDYRN